MDKGNRSSTGDDFAGLAGRLLDVFNNVLEFVSAVLATHGYYDKVAHWVEQTYKAVRKLGSAFFTATTPPTTSTTSNKPTWARRG
jgi:hypothetical protein